jgi:ketosteroid isomerase-like protein
MKKQIIFMAAVGFLAISACKQATPIEQLAISETPDYAAFDQKVAVVRAFYQAHSDEDLEAQRALLSDTMTYSPPHFNGNKWLGKEEMLAALKNYHDNFDNIKFMSGIVMPDTIANGYWSGSVFPKGTATTTPTNIRVYGTWSATHTASGKAVGVKYFALISVNDDGKIVSASDYFDVNGLAAQIAAE